MSKQLIFDISLLADQPTGRKETYSFQEEIKYPELDFASSCQGKLEIMRVEDGFNVRVFDFTTKIILPCDLCTKKFTQPLKIIEAERVFWIDKPKTVEDPNDLYLIDKKNLKVDISEMLRQEIVLHLPINPVCSKSCKSQAKDFSGDNAENKPLSALKDLIK